MVRKAIRILSMLKITFESRNPGLCEDLYVSLVRLHLKDDVQVCNPHLQVDIEKIARVKRRATRIPLEFALEISVRGQVKTIQFDEF